MARIFRLGDFFGLTAAELALFTPSRINDLLACRYTAQINESLYSLCKEIEFLKGALTTDAMKPDYDVLIPDFKLFGYLGFNDETSDNKAKLQLAKFYNDYEKISIEELRSKYGSETDEMIKIIKESVTIDVGAAFPGISTEGVAIVNVIYKNLDFLNDLSEKCCKAYEGSHTHEVQIAGRPVRDILELDKGDSINSPRCCSFTHQLLTKLRLARTDLEITYALKELEHDIENIQKEYDAKDIIFTSVSEIADILDDVYSEMTVDRFKEVTGLTDISTETIERVLKELDSFFIGGIGLNSQEMGRDVLESIAHEDTSGWSVKGHERNDKLDAVLRLAYIDLKSRRFMMNI